MRDGGGVDVGHQGGYGEDRQGHRAGVGERIYHDVS